MPSSTAAVNSFKLKSMPDSITNAGIPLDSVFFSIDLNRGIIFNADSLPLGTKIDKLIPVISYTSSASEVKIIQKGGRKEGEIDYKSNPNDTVDFTGSVTLSIKAEDPEYSRDYTVKINVHKVEPDSLVWDRMAVTPLPSRMGNPREQKTVAFKDKTYSLIEEKDGSMTLSISDDIIEGIWTKQPLVLDFDADVRSLAAAPEFLGVLDKSGVLHTSPDGKAWENTGRTWHCILGCYDSALIGIRNEGSGLVHTSWPASAGFTEQPVDPGFPVDGYSQFVQFSNKWTTLPIGFITGGRTADGKLTSKTWGFDGDSWVVLSESMIPAVSGAVVVPYFVYRKTSSSLIQTEFSVWMLIGGRLSDDASNRNVYVSYDNGVNWYAASQGMQLPADFPGLRQLDALMVEWPKQASIEDNWKKAPLRGLPTRAGYEIEDWKIYWDCPYIYIFGGTNESGALNDQVWRGVLNRLSFTPPF